MAYGPAQLPGSVLPASGLPVSGLPAAGLPAAGLPISRLLAGDADRDRAVDVLRAGFAEGRLTQEEFTERVARAYESRTYGELGELVADLPAGPIPAHAQLAFRGPAPTRRDEGVLAPSLTGLALTAVVVFVLAAFVTGVAVLLHAHGQPGMVPFPHAHLQPFVHYRHRRLG